MKKWLISLLVLCAVALGGSVLAEPLKPILPYYPEDYHTVCYVGWIEGYTYYHQTHWSIENMPDVLPPEGWDAELISEAYCLSPNGGWVAVRDDFSREIYVPLSRYTF